MVALVGLTRPDLFALGAAIGPPASRMRSKVVVVWHTNIVVLSSPANNETSELIALFNIIVSGPGQNVSANLRDRGQKSTKRFMENLLHV